MMLFSRLMLRPLRQEPGRALINILAVALGVGVVLAIDLSGQAAAGSFRSSLETLPARPISKSRRRVGCRNRCMGLWFVCRSRCASIRA